MEILDWTRYVFIESTKSYFPWLFPLSQLYTRLNLAKPKGEQRKWHGDICRNVDI